MATRTALADVLWAIRGVGYSTRVMKVLSYRAIAMAMGDADKHPTTNSSIDLVGDVLNKMAQRIGREVTPSCAVRILRWCEQHRADSARDTWLQPRRGMAHTRRKGLHDVAREPNAVRVGGQFHRDEVRKSLRSSF